MERVMKIRRKVRVFGKIQRKIRIKLALKQNEYLSKRILQLQEKA